MSEQQLDQMANEKQERKMITTCCPKCNQESFSVAIIDSGKSLHPEYGDVYWFKGEGKCVNCGYEDKEYSDSSV